MWYSHYILRAIPTYGVLLHAMIPLQIKDTSSRHLEWKDSFHYALYFLTAYLTNEGSGMLRIHSQDVYGSSVILYICR